MCGSATLAMAVSSSSMNVAKVTVTAMTHGLIAGRSRYGQRNRETGERRHS